LADVFENLAETTQDALTSTKNSISALDNKLDNTKLDDLDDVDISAPFYGQFPSYETSSGSFINNDNVSAVMAFDDAAGRDAAITVPLAGNIVYLRNTDELLRYTGVGWDSVGGGAGFTARSVITATNTSWPVPSLGSPIVKVTVIGGGGGGGGATGSLPTAGGTTTFNAGGAGSVSAAGGPRGSNLPPSDSSSRNGITGTAGLASHNGGTGGVRFQSFSNRDAYGGSTGGGGKIQIAYLNLEGISTVSVTIGAGGSGTSGGNANGGNGGRGEVIFEYVAA
jgi:hypothetical protein